MKSNVIKLTSTFILTIFVAACGGEKEALTPRTSITSNDNHQELVISLSGIVGTLIDSEKNIYRLAWKAADGVDSYFVSTSVLAPVTPADCKGDQPGENDQITDQPFVDMQVSPGSQYFFRVCANDADRTINNTYSSIPGGLGNDISGLTIHKVGSNFADLAFMSKADTFEAYKVTLAKGNATPKDCSSRSVKFLAEGPVVVYRLKGLESAAGYSVRVCGIDSQGNVSKGLTTEFKTGKAKTVQRRSITGQVLSFVGMSNLGLFGMYLIGLLYTENLESGFSQIETKLGMLFFPFLGFHQFTSS